MGEKIRIMALYEAKDDKSDLVSQLKNADPEIKVDVLPTTYNLMEKLQENEYDCVVSDTIVKGFDVIELAKRIRELYNTPFIIYTDNGSEELALKALHEGIPYHFRNIHDKKRHEKFVQRIKFMVKKNRLRKNGNTFTTPSGPTVFVKGSDVYVIEDDGSETLWGCEEVDTEDVAKKMDMELKATNYVRNELAKRVTELSENLLQTEIPPADVPDIVHLGYMKLSKWFKNTNEFNKSSPS
jgi:CheY-like chemotaxis protein